MRRQPLLIIAAALLVLGVGLLSWRTFGAPTVVRVAVGPSGSEDAKLIAAAGQYLVREHNALRLKLVPTSGEAESATALDDGRADFAVVRSDIAMPEAGQTVAILHRDAALIVTLPGRGIENLTDLRNRTVGIVRDIPANAQLLRNLLAHYEIPTDDVRVVILPGAGEVADALRSGRVDAVLAVGSMSGLTLGDTVAGAASARDGGAPVFVPVNIAEAIALRSPVYEALDLVRGVFGGTPPSPQDNVKTVGVTHRLVASSTLEDATVSELTKLLFTMRPALARDVPLANRIEAPDTSKSAALPVHPGASAYYNDEVETFFEKYDDWIYIGAMVLSVVGSGFAGLLSTASARRRARTLGLLDRLLSIVRLARVAGTQHELDGLEAEVDEILGVALGKAGTGGLDDAAVSAFTLGLDQARHAISERRRVIGRGTPPLAEAAE